MDRITTSSITAGLDIPFGRLREWIVRGYIKPSFPSPGQGMAAEFTIDDVYKIKAFQQMIDGGLTREAASAFIEAVEEYKTDKQIDVIIFRRSGNWVSQMGVNLDEGDIVLDLRDGFPGDISKYPDFAVGLLKSYKDFEDIYILNFKKIREFVDSRF